MVRWRRRLSSGNVVSFFRAGSMHLCRSLGTSGWHNTVLHKAVPNMRHPNAATPHAPNPGSRPKPALPGLQVCTLYRNEKDAPEFLFLAAASLYALTGNAAYRADADKMWPTGPQSVEQQTFLYNWNNVLIQGVVILSMEADSPGATRNRDFYRRFLRTSVSLWSQCSNEGESIINFYRFCECVPPTLLPRQSANAPGRGAHFNRQSIAGSSCSRCITQRGQAPPGPGQRSPRGSAWSMCMGESEVVLPALSPVAA